MTAETDVDIILIDEIESHFHPDLQRKVLEVLKPLVANRFVLATTQSPAVMMSADPDKLYFLKHYTEVGPGENQLVNLGSDLALIDSLSSIYVGFGSDVRLLRHLSYSASLEILRYAEECTRESEVLGPEKGQDVDPQVATFRSALLALQDEATIVEYGVGKGRLLAAFGPLQRQRVETWSYVAYDIDQSNEGIVSEYCRVLGIQFKKFVFQHTLPVDDTVDLTLLANVLHEVGPEKMAELLSWVLRHARAGSIVLILEALELAVGEKRFVVFDGNSLAAIFNRCREAGTVRVAVAVPHSYGGTPLLEARLEVLDPTNARIEDEDILKGLDAVIDAEGAKIARSLSAGTETRPRVLAFNCHNLANAVAFRQILEQDVERRRSTSNEERPPLSSV